jgi:hypothetical protein
MRPLSSAQVEAMDQVLNSDGPARALTRLRMAGWELVKADLPDAGPRTVTVGLHLTDEHGGAHTFHQYTVPIPDPKRQPTLADASLEELLEAVRVHHTTVPTPTPESED